MTTTSSRLDRSQLLTSAELVKRWEASLYPVSPLTLARWRRRGYGPDFIKVGAAGRVFYLLPSVETFEAHNSIGNLSNIPTLSSTNG